MCVCAYLYNNVLSNYLSPISYLSHCYEKELTRQLANFGLCTS